mmetsp:Transcript_28172/g.74784  ORF Transcript_28172/g.74784 Transcript_28172/m.74784 type:complete len:230 (+) Transcript_28172:235-924(+)
MDAHGVFSPPLHVDVVPCEAVENSRRVSGILVKRGIHPQHRNAHVVEILQVPVMDRLHLWQICVPIWQTIEVALATAAVCGNRRTTEIAWRANTTNSSVGISGRMVKELWRCCIPSPGTGDPAVSVSTAIPARAWHRVLACSWTRRRDVIEDDIDDHLHACGPAGGHHALELLGRPGARVQAEGDGLILGPPLRAADVLRDRRDLHRIEAAWAEILLALSSDVYIIPLP